MPNSQSKAIHLYVFIVSFAFNIQHKSECTRYQSAAHLMCECLVACADAFILFYFRHRNKYLTNCIDFILMFRSQNKSIAWTTSIWSFSFNKIQFNYTSIGCSLRPSIHLALICSLLQFISHHDTFSFSIESTFLHWDSLLNHD